MAKAFHTKKKVIYQALRERVFSLKPGEHLGRTIHQLADDFGVSHRTVSAAVRMLKQEGLLLARRKIGLMVHPRRPEPVRKTAPLLFLSQTEMEKADLFEQKIYNGIAATLRDRDLYILYKNVSDLGDLEDLAREGTVSEAVVSCYAPDSAVKESCFLLSELGLRVCAVDEEIKGIDSVVLDNRSIGRMAGRFLFTRSGFRRVLLLRRYSYAQAEYERETGITEILIEMGVSHSRFTWMSTIITPEEIRGQLGRFLANGFVFDAAFCHTPYIATALRDLAKDAGLPEPFLVTVGTEQELREHGVAGIAVSPEEMGEKAVELLMERRRDPFRPPQTVRLEGRIFIP